MMPAFVIGLDLFPGRIRHAFGEQRQTAAVLFGQKHLKSQMVQKPDGGLPDLGADITGVAAGEVDDLAWAAAVDGRQMFEQRLGGKNRW